MADRADVEDLLKAVNETSGGARTIWVTFLLFGTYLAIAVGATTHRDLLLENAVTLPFLQNVRLNLFAFYWVAPLLLVLYHLYLLVTFCVLASKLHTFNRSLNALRLPIVARVYCRQRVHGFLLSQALAGPRRVWLLASATRLTLWATVFLAPVALLLVFQIRFLPYHSVAMTWAHRCFLLFDLLMLWSMWPIILNPRSDPWAPSTPAPAPARLREPETATAAWRGSWPASWRGWHARRSDARELHGIARSPGTALVTAVVALPTALFSLIIATLSEETVAAGPWRLASTLREELAATAVAYLPTVEIRGRQEIWLTGALFEGPTNWITGRPNSPFSRNLVLVSEDLSGASAIGATTGPRLRNRDLRYAILVNVDLSGADLTAADLRGASLEDSDLSGAKLACQDDKCVDLSGAFLSGTNLEGAMLVHADLTGADLGDARLQGAALSWANLQVASLEGARLEAASLIGASLQGASFAGANLRGASLREAHLWGARFDDIDLALTDLTAADYRHRLSTDGSVSEVEAMEHLRTRVEAIDSAAVSSAQTQLKSILDASEREPSATPDSQVPTMASRGMSVQRAMSRVDFIARAACMDRNNPFIWSGIAFLVEDTEFCHVSRRLAPELARRLLDRSCGQSTPPTGYVAQSLRDLAEATSAPKGSPADCD